MMLRCCWDAVEKLSLDKLCLEYFEGVEGGPVDRRAKKSQEIDGFKIWEMKECSLMKRHS
jgi:hypothetical protein